MKRSIRILVCGFYRGAILWAQTGAPKTSTPGVISPNSTLMFDVELLRIK
jgi:hypothetical protein